jgi:hypothetical protein
MGLTPTEVGISDFDIWPKGLDAKYSTEAVNKIIDFSELTMHKICTKPYTPKNITNSFINHTMSLTQRLRTTMEESKERPPDNPREMPGKLDHVTCVSFAVSHATVNHVIVENTYSSSPTLNTSWTKATKTAVTPVFNGFASLGSSTSSQNSASPPTALSLPCVLEDNADLNEQAFQQLWNKLFGSEVRGWMTC